MNVSTSLRGAMQRAPSAALAALWVLSGPGLAEVLPGASVPAGATALAQSAEAERTVAGDRTTGGAAAGLPWDADPVGGRAPVLAAALNGRWDLTRRGERGEERVYEISRVNLSLDRMGRPVNRVEVEGTVRRILLEETGRGLWRERFVWDRFAMGQASGNASGVTLGEIEAARGLQYEVRPESFDPSDPPGDFGRLGPGLAATLMKVLAIDLHTWDALVDNLREVAGDTVDIGASAWLPASGQVLDLAAPVGDRPMTSYQMGEMRISMAGLTRRAGEAAALLWFSIQGSRVTQHLEGPPVTLRMEGTEYFSGVMTVSLRDGRVLAGRLWGPVPSRTELALPGQELKEQPTSAVLQEVVFQEIDRSG